ncbi:MAG: hypothetical protein M3081_19645 [Gemmatimonadota bacterium]|nr:hypothetical protein [Gemmatimonadota bacterium]
MYANDGESGRDALSRLRPDVVLIESANDVLSSDAFLGPAMMMGVKIIVFGAQRSSARLDDLRDRLGAGVLMLPVRPGQMAEVIERVLQK